MAKKKSSTIESIEDEIKQLEKQKKELLKLQRKEIKEIKNKRLIERGMILESLIAESEKLSNEQIKDFLIKTISTPFAVKILENIREDKPSEI